MGLRSSKRCTFPPAHPEGCQCLREKCSCGHDLSGHDTQGCHVSSGLLGKPESMVACNCSYAFNRESYLSALGNHDGLGCCEWHILYGKPWIPVLDRAKDDAFRALVTERDELRAKFDSACDLLVRTQAHLDSAGTTRLGESYIDDGLPRLIRERDELRAENERLRAVVKIAGIHHHDGCKGCFAVQSAIRRLGNAKDG